MPALQEFAEHLRAYGFKEHQICGYDHFLKTFKTDARLRDILIASGKENFGRCNVCAELNQAVKNARKVNDPLILQQAKQKRLAHYLMEKGDKISYYAFRDKARHTATDLMSLIIDKMDDNKNKCPRQHITRLRTHVYWQCAEHVFLILS
eukprot:6023093-Pleurochrysis_carterae.AAC.1